MVQVRKDEVNKQILNSAQNLFSNKGYAKTTIKDISDDSEVSVGNIYRYYKNKKLIFESLISDDFVADFKDKLEGKILGKLDTNSFLDFILAEKEKFLLLFADAKGTRYENLTQDLIMFMTEIVMNKYFENSDENIKQMISRIYLNYINAMKWIIQNYRLENDIIIQLNYLNTYHQNGIIALIKGRN